MSVVTDYAELKEAARELIVAANRCAVSHVGRHGGAIFDILRHRIDRVAEVIERHESEEPTP